ncbi:hypothetical protein ACFYTS_23420 [Nocardia sp. NPDC004151]|uniref:hypothetical protein n=1 Tax=Nocardia sp. NPDC004151 TaxID=3364304 RepID=UPI0036B0251A
MRKTLALAAMALGIAGLGAATAHAETLTVDGSYPTVDACASDGNNGRFQAGGVQLRGEDGWQWSCDQGWDGQWYMTIFR